MEIVTGFISYDVHVKCPSCDARLNLNDYPYTDDETDYSHAEDELGLALFGTKTDPATWESVGIKYKCCRCQSGFVLDGFEA